MKDVFNLTDKVAVIIGGGGGIGGAIAKGYAYYGAKVIISGRTEATLQAKAEEIKEEIGKEIDYMCADSTVPADVAKLRDDIVAKYGTVDILVNAQGINRKFAAAESVEHIAEWDEMFNTNVRSMLLCCVEFGKVMIEKRYGKIINISSIRGARALTAPGNNVGYGSTKGAVNMMTEYLAGEWGQYNVTVNAIGPIVTITPMMLKLGVSQQVLDVFKKKVPMGRAGEPDDNIGPALFLGSDLSSFVTGQIIYPDGGMWCVG
mgnify:FL=1